MSLRKTVLIQTPKHSPPINDGEFYREPNRNRDDREQQPDAESLHDAHGRATPLGVQF